MARNQIRSYEKAQNFKLAIAKLIKYLKPYLLPIIISMLMVVIATICTLIGPNRISKITDVIQQGLSANITLTEEQQNKLETDSTVSIGVENKTLTLMLENDDLIIKLNDVKFATLNYETLKDNKYFDLSEANIAVAYDGTVQVLLKVNASVNIAEILRICLALIVIYVAAYIANLTQGVVMAIVTQKVSKDLRSSISRKIANLPLGYFNNTTYGNVLSVVTNDVDMISQTLNHTITDLTGALFQFVGAFIFMIATNYIMALSGIAATLLGFIIMAIIIKYSQKYFGQIQQDIGMLNGYIEEVYSGQEIIKAYNAENSVTKEFDILNQNAYRSGWKSRFLSDLMPPIMGFVGNLGYVTVCVVGALLVFNGMVNFSAIIAIMIYIRLFTQPLSKLAQGASSLQTTAASSERIFELLDQEEMKDEGHLIQKLEDIKGNVEFVNCKFGYTEKIVIKNFSAKVKAGQKVAIVGPTGAGKTTLVNLLMKFYELNAGDIIIDGKSIHEISRDAVHDAFGMVLQDTWLFQGSIKENIRYSKKDVTDEQIEQACHACGLHHFIKTMPNGYDTILDDNTSISAGQKQLLTIARAMVENAPMLILDEATSSVDTRTEILIQQAMDKLTENRTSFVIAHRLSTIKNADVIFVMKDGDIVEQGNHKELLAKNGFYAELYNSQFEEVE